MIVMKFGGTSNQDAAAMTNVIRIVMEGMSRRPVVVISAIAKATNELEETARAAASGNPDGAANILDRLFARHVAILGTLIKGVDRARELRSAFASYLDELKTLVQGVAILRELTPRTLDAFCSYGERLSSRIIAAGLQEAGADAVCVDVKEFMLTDDNYGRAMPLMDTVTSNLARVLRPLIDRGVVPVTQGFIGVTQGGSYTTMGRESSDFTASIIGAAMGAERVQIWTDVDGILTADPQIVNEVKKVKRMSFEEAFELSYFGAKVLHPNTMLPLLRKNIPVEIRNSRSKGGTGTMIDLPAPASADGPLVKSIAFKPNITIVTVTPHKRVNQYLFWEGAFSILSRYGLNTGNVTTSEYSLAFTVDGKFDAPSMKARLEEFGHVTMLPNKGSICLVGSGLRGCAGFVNRVFAALANVNISMIAYGASELNMTIILEHAQVADALLRLHREFFGGSGIDDIFDVPVN